MESLAGNLLLDARARAGLSRREFARRAGTSPAALLAYERGTRDPSVQTLQKILAAAGLELRVRLAPRDDHDQVLQAWRDSLPPEIRTEGDAHRKAFFDEAKVTARA